MTPDLIYDQMVGMGMVRKMIFSWTGNPGVGSLHRVREAIEQGWPRPLEIEEHSHAAMANAYEAGASGLPCAIFRGYIGVDLPKVNPNIRFIECPFTGERLAAIPSHRPDVAVIHALRADKAGNVLLEGIVGVQKEAVLAAKRAVVTVEEIVDELYDARSGASPDARGSRNANAIILPTWTVSAIACVPGGAFPSYAHGYYTRNNKFYIDWDEISRDRATFLAVDGRERDEAGPASVRGACATLSDGRGAQHDLPRAKLDHVGHGDARGRFLRHAGRRRTDRVTQFADTAIPPGRIVRARPCAGVHGPTAVDGPHHRRYLHDRLARQPSAGEPCRDARASGRAEAIQDRPDRGDERAVRRVHERAAGKADRHGAGRTRSLRPTSRRPIARCSSSSPAGHRPTP